MKVLMKRWCSLCGRKFENVLLLGAIEDLALHVEIDHLVTSATGPENGGEER